MIHAIETTIQPRIGQAISLSRGHVDNLTLTFHYQELIAGQVVEREQKLTEAVHFSLDAPTGRVTLLSHALWDTMGTWRAGDRSEPLLYKGQVKAPQYIAAAFDYYAPGETVITTDKAQVYQEALTLTVTSEVDGDVPVAIHSDGRKVGAVNVAVSGGQGEHSMTVGAGVPAGRYTLSADRDVLDPEWSLPLYGSEGVEVEVA